MTINEEQIRSIVQSVVNRLSSETAAPAGPTSPLPQISTGDGIFNDLEEAINAAELAQNELMRLPLAKREEMIEAMRQAGRDNAEKISVLAHQESGMGRVESKIKKHLLVSNKTPGLEDLQPIAWSGDHGLTLVERAPFNQPNLDRNLQLDRDDRRREFRRLRTSSGGQGCFPDNDPDYESGYYRRGRTGQPHSSAERTDN